MGRNGESGAFSLAAEDARAARESRILFLAEERVLKIDTRKRHPHTHTGLRIAPRVVDCQKRLFTNRGRDSASSRDEQKSCDREKHQSTPVSLIINHIKQTLSVRKI